MELCQGSLGEKISTTLLLDKRFIKHYVRLGSSVYIHTHFEVLWIRDRIPGVHLAVALLKKTRI